MTSQAQNFSLVEGNDKDLLVSVIDSDEAVVNIGGAEFVWKLASSETSSSALVTKRSDSTNGITIVSAAAGTLKIHLDPDDTTGLSGVYYHELKMTDFEGNVTTVLTGYVEIITSLID